MDAGLMLLHFLYVFTNFFSMNQEVFVLALGNIFKEFSIFIGIFFDGEGKSI